MPAGIHQALSFGRAVPGVSRLACLVLRANGERCQVAARRDPSAYSLTQGPGRYQPRIRGAGMMSILIMRLLIIKKGVGGWVPNSPLFWRRGRDSNPGWGCPHNGFRDRPVQPLRHLSGALIITQTGRQVDSLARVCVRIAGHALQRAEKGAFMV